MTLQHPRVPVADGGHLNSRGMCVLRGLAVASCAHSSSCTMRRVGYDRIVVSKPGKIAGYGCSMQHAIASHIHTCILRLHVPLSCLGRDSRGRAATLCSQLCAAQSMWPRCCMINPDAHVVSRRPVWSLTLSKRARHCEVCDHAYHSQCIHVWMQPRYLSCIIAAMLLPQSLHCTSRTTITDIPHHQ
jgi:hypothetical protein